MMKSSTKTAALSSYVNTAIRDYMKNHDESVDFPQEIWEVMTTDLAIFSPILSSTMEKSIIYNSRPGLPTPD